MRLLDHRQIHTQIRNRGSMRMKRIRIFPNMADHRDLAKAAIPCSPTVRTLCREIRNTDKHTLRDSRAYSVLPNDEAQTPRWGRPNSVVFSNTLRVIGVVCSAWFAAFLFLVQVAAR